MEDMIVVIKRGRKNWGPLIMENIDRIAIAKIVKVSNVIDLSNKYSWAISNTDIDTTGNLGLTGIKKYWKYTCQIQNKIDRLYKD